MSNRCGLVCALAGAFVLSGCRVSAQMNGRATPLEDTHWKVESVGGTKVEAASPERAPFLELDRRSHRMVGFGGCNQLAGPYELEGDHLRFTGMTRTMMACVRVKSEGELVDALDKVREWKVAGRTLSLMDGDGHVLARFVATP